MTAEIALWVLSTFGAVVFFSLGWVSNVIRRPAGIAQGPAIPVAPPADDPALRNTQEQLASVRAELDARSASLRKLETEHRTIQQALDAARKQAADRDAIALALQQAKARAADRDELARTLDAAQRRPDDSKKLADQLEAANRRYEQDKRVWQEQTRVEAEKLHRQIDELRAVLSGQGSLQQQLEKARAELTSARADMESLRAAASGHANLQQHFEKARAELASARADTEKLRVAASDSTAVKQQLEKARAELAATKAAMGQLRDGSAKDSAKALAAITFELEQVRTQLRSAEAQSTHAAKLEAELRDARILIETEKAKARELETLREELTKLREQSNLASGAQTELTRIGSDLQTARVELAQARKRVEDLERVREANRELQEENQRLKGDLSHTAGIEEEIKALRQKVQLTEARSLEAEELRQQTRDLRDRLREVERFEEDAKRTDALDAELRAAKLEVEVLRRRVDDAGKGSDERLALAQELQQARQRAAEADVLQERVHALEARLFAVGLAEEKEVTVPAAWKDQPETPLQHAPNQLVQAGARTSVLADSAGLPIASAGLPAHQESLAALSGLAMEFASRVATLLPVSAIRLIQLVDQRDMTVYWSVFDSHGEPYCLSALGPSLPDGNLLQESTLLAQVSVNQAGGLG
jgi:DNA repair exonuclease SbcCD ATPase subunit